MRLLSKQEDKQLTAVRNKISKGWTLTEFYYCGIPNWKFVKDDRISSYPRVNENLVVCVLYDNGIKIDKGY